MISLERQCDSPLPRVHEGKYVIHNSVAHKVVAWLQGRCWPDREFPAGIVASIYYDSRDWRFLGEKINSDYMKTKVRVRWYQDINTKEPLDASFMEVKYKTGGIRRKIRVKTPHSGAWLCETELNDPKLMALPDLLKLGEVFLQGPLFPVFQISYKRRRFVDPVSGLRLSIDYDIHVPRVNPAMVPRFNSANLNSAVFETKGGNSRLPEPLHQLTALGCRKQSFSKYSMGYQKIMRTDF
ncbi:MAG TPA: VTC domain-containing protein [Candidatus Aminicenantes bacterium]|nr:VTC domain-containing protein [Candidatus Aminicenantes bacterium]